MSVKSFNHGSSENRETNQEKHIETKKERLGEWFMWSREIDLHIFEVLHKRGSIEE